MAVTGGSSPVKAHKVPRRMTQRKLVYPSTGLKGGGFQTNPSPACQLEIYRKAIKASSVKNQNNCHPPKTAAKRRAQKKTG